jgi:hypothetical protein
MKISNLRGEDAIDKMADLIEPITIIASDKEFENLYNSKPLIFAVKHCLKNHKHEVLEILAIINCEEPDNFNPKFWELPKMVLEVLADEDVKSLFTFQQMQNSNDTSFAAVELTKEKETM